MSELILQTRAVLDDGLSNVRIRILDGIIQDIEKLSDEVEDNRVLFPGFIDVHVHAREYALPPNADNKQKAAWQKMTSKETFRSAGDAAINGGVVLYAAMPNDPVPPSDPKTYSSKCEVAKASDCPAIVLACITRTSEPWSDLPYKLYLDHRPSDFSFSYWDEVDETLKRYAGRSVFFHAEDPLALAERSHLRERWKSRPPEAEIKAVRKILELTAKYSLQTHICHISTIEAVRILGEFNRTASKKVTSEVTPHHLFFSVDESGIRGDGAVVYGNRSFFDCNPPLRSENDRTGLIEALRDGSIDMVAGDHAPHTLEDKAGGAPGMPQLDTFGAFAAWLITRHGFSFEKVAEIFSTAPAALMSNYVDGKYGVIRIGDVANMTMLDLSEETLVRGSQISSRGPLMTRCAWSPFDGIALPGSVRQTIVQGRLAYPFNNF